MDERTKACFQKIQSELFTLILILCCLSVIVKIAFFGMELSDCIPEFPIMILSPVYLAVRSRMLGVTQASAFAGKNLGRSRTAIAAALFIFIVVFTAMSENRGDPVDWQTALGSGAIFLAAFFLVQVLYKRLEERRQKKLDSRYDD